ncbi:MAG: two-component sensor histidine kinase [Christensenellaceae bacterium]|jgi:signal transduction histidine kinase|nr:two-component sensor histidine kinase [Christensenellaceae bacterium]
MRKLRSQLSLAFVLVVFITVAVISLFSNALVNRQFETYILNQQSAKTQNIRDNLSLCYNAQTGVWNPDSVHMLGMYALYDGYIIKVSDGLGNSVWDAENHDMALCHDIMEEISTRMKQHGSTGDFVSHEYALASEGGAIGSVAIRYFGPYFLNESDFAFLHSLNILLVIVGVAALLLSFITGAALAKRIARPITKTADIALQIAAGKYDIQFEGRTKTWELHNLVSAINHLANALGNQEKLRKRLTADVAHELRTPLTTLGSHLEAMIEGVWEPTPERLRSCHEEILRLGKIVEDLERLERAESDNLKLCKAPVDLLALMRGVGDAFAGELLGKGLRLAVEGRPTVLAADKDRLSGVLTNLLSNAVKYTPQGGAIFARIQDFPQESVLILEDTGPGIPEEELPFIFERFYRADTSRNRKTGGAGIGLAIVKSVVLAHGGQILAENRAEGGCRFTLRLPKEG